MYMYKGACTTHLMQYYLATHNKHLYTCIHTYMITYTAQCTPEFTFTRDIQPGQVLQC